MTFLVDVLAKELQLWVYFANEYRFPFFCRRSPKGLVDHSPVMGDVSLESWLKHLLITV